MLTQRWRKSPLRSAARDSGQNGQRLKMRSSSGILQMMKVNEFEAELELALVVPIIRLETRNDPLVSLADLGSRFISSQINQMPDLLD